MKKLPENKELSTLYIAKNYLKNAYEFFYECDQFKENKNEIIIKKALWKSAIVAYCAGIKEIERGKKRYFNSCTKVCERINELCKKLDHSINIHHFLKAYRNKAICHADGIQRLSFKITKKSDEFEISEDIFITDGYDGRNELYYRYIGSILETITSQYNLCCKNIASKFTDEDYHTLEYPNLTIPLITAFEGEDLEKARICSLEIFNPDYFKSDFYKKSKQ